MTETTKPLLADHLNKLNDTLRRGLDKQATGIKWEHTNVKGKSYLRLSGQKMRNAFHAFYDNAYLLAALREMQTSYRFMGIRCNIEGHKNTYYDLTIKGERDIASVLAPKRDEHGLPVRPGLGRKRPPGLGRSRIQGAGL